MALNSDMLPCINTSQLTRPSHMLLPLHDCNDTASSLVTLHPDF